jgi:transcriptional regulator with XRE-family HTH domain
VEKLFKIGWSSKCPFYAGRNFQPLIRVIIILLEVKNVQEDYLKWIASRIEDLRESKGVSAREMSRGIDKEETYIRKIETEKITPSIPVLLEICHYLGISLKDFFDNEIENPELLNELIELLRPLGKYEIESITSIVELIAKNKNV